MKNLWKSKVFRVVMGLALVMVLTLAAALPAMAANKAKDPLNVNETGVNLVKGTVTSIAGDAKSFQILTAQADNQTIIVDNNTRYFSIERISDAVKLAETNIQTGKPAMKNAPLGQDKKSVQNGKQSKNAKKMSGGVAGQSSNKYKVETNQEEAVFADNVTQPGIWGKLKSMFNRNPKMGQTAAFSDLAAGDEVVVKVMPNENLAKQVLIIKSSEIKTVKGDISAVTSASLTLTPRDASVTPVVLKWDRNSRIVIQGDSLVKNGQFGVAIFRISDMTIIHMDVFPEMPAAISATAAGIVTE